VGVNSPRKKAPGEPILSSENQKHPTFVFPAWRLGDLFFWSNLVVLVGEGTNAPRKRTDPAPGVERFRTRLTKFSKRGPHMGGGTEQAGRDHVQCLEVQCRRKRFTATPKARKGPRPEGGKGRTKMRPSKREPLRGYSLQKTPPAVLDEPKSA